MISQDDVIKGSYDTPKVSHQRTKWGSHMHCGIGDIMVLVCYIILQDQVQYSNDWVTLWVKALPGKSLSY